MDSLWVYPNHPLVYQTPFAPALFYRIPKYPEETIFMMMRRERQNVVTYQNGARERARNQLYSPYLFGEMQH